VFHQPAQRKKYSYAAQCLLHPYTSMGHNLAIADSGATSHFLMTAAPVTDQAIATTPLRVKLPNGTILHSSHTCMLDLPALPPQARKGHIIPGLANHSLISIVQLCKAGCKVLFEKDCCKVILNDKIILCGFQCHRTGLWMLPLNENTYYDKMRRYVGNQQEHSAANVFHTTTKADLAQYFHQCLFSPPTTTLLKAIKNDQLLSFPGLTPELITKHLPESTATWKGHMHRTRKGIRSTRKQDTSTPTDTYDVHDMNPPEELNATETDLFCFAVLADTVEGTIYIDLTGRFPVRSYRNNQYTFVCYDYRSNSIHVRAMKLREDKDMVEAFQAIYN